MFTVADVGRIRIYVGVPQAYAAAMKAGLEATLTVPDEPGQTFAAKVVGTSDAINPQNGALAGAVAGRQQAHALRAGGYAQVSFKVPGSGWRGDDPVERAAVPLGRHASGDGGQRWPGAPGADHAGPRSWQDR
jgi:hypothetical protein